MIPIHRPTATYSVIGSLLMLCACASPEPLPINSVTGDEVAPATLAAVLPHSSTRTATLRSVPPESAPTNHDRRPTHIGTITAPALTEISGLASSMRRRNQLWAVNDSGNQSRLYAIATDGSLLVEVPVTPVNRDWESLTSYRDTTDAWLVLADIGDNLGVHREYRLHWFREPDLGALAASSGPLIPERTLRFVYPDGHPDSEAMAISIRDQQILLITKSSQAAVLYSLPFVTEQLEQPVTAQRLGQLAVIPSTLADRMIMQLTGVDLSQVTGVEISADGQHAWVLTYRGLYRFSRQTPDEPWAAVFGRAPTLQTRHTLPQAEAMAVTADDAIIFTSERLPASLLQVR